MYNYPTHILVYWNVDDDARDARHFEARERAKRNYRRWSVASQVRRDIEMCHSYNVQGSKHAVY